MKSPIQTALLTILLVSACLPRHVMADSPNGRQVLDILFDHLSARFPAKQSCGSDNTQPATVRQFIQDSLFYASQETKPATGIAVNCDKVILGQDLLEYYRSTQGEQAAALGTELRKLKQGTTLYQCDVTIHHTAGENVWSRGIQFLLREDNNRSVKFSFRCLTTP